MVNYNSTSFLYLNETPYQITRKIRDEQEIIHIEKLKAKLYSLYQYGIQYPSTIYSTTNNCI